MRVAPLGACFAGDLPRVIEQAARSAEVTHTHPEAIAGAIATAVAAAHAVQRHQAGSGPEGAAFLAQIIQSVPASAVRDGLIAACALPTESQIWEVVRLLGNGSGVAAQDTVPYVLWCAAHRLDSYPEAIWLTASGFGDIDTNCAMVGGIVACATGKGGIPTDWLHHREPLASWAFVATP